MSVNDCFVSLPTGKSVCYAADSSPSERSPMTMEESVPGATFAQLNKNRFLQFFNMGNMQHFSKLAAFLFSKIPTIFYFLIIQRVR